MKTTGLMILAALLTVAALYLYLTEDVINLVRQSFRGDTAHLMIMAVLVVILTQYLRAWRFSILVSGKIGLPPFQIYRISAVLSFLNIMVPFRLGELSFPILMKRAYKFGLVRGVGTLMLTRVLDLFAGIGFATALAGSLGIHIAGINPVVFATFAVISFSALLAIPFLGQAAEERIATLLGRWPIAVNLVMRLFHAVRALRRAEQKTLVIALTLMIWVSLLSIAALSARIVIDDISFVSGAFAGAAASLSFALPINGVGGLGPMQAVWAFALEIRGLSWSEGIASALLWNAALVSASGLLVVLTFPLSGSAAQPRDQGEN